MGWSTLLSMGWENGPGAPGRAPSFPTNIQQRALGEGEHHMDQCGKHPEGSRETSHKDAASGRGS